MKYIYVASVFICIATAFPRIPLETIESFDIASNTFEKRVHDPVKNPVDPHPGFNAKKQYVSISGKHKFISPSPTDVRGPCPGLNAMSNHGYLPRDGVGTLEDFIEGCYEAFGMGRDIGAFLAVYGAVFDGNLESYSIGGPAAKVLPINGLLGTPTGLSGSHNKYENDASPMRGDLYLFGNDYKTQIANFEEFYKTQEGVPDDKVNFDLEIIKAFRHRRFRDSIEKNPYFFNGPFSGAIASAAAFAFIFRFMGNKSAEYPEGRLDRYTLKKFYSITGEPGSFKYTPGHESFPENWYKRAIGDAYTIPFFNDDALAQDISHPEFISIGGNLGKVNSFTGIDPANLTGGAYNDRMLLKGNNAVCFGYELGLMAAPDILEGLYNDITPAMNKLSEAFAKATKGLHCPKIGKLQYSQFNKFPGYRKHYKGYPGSGK